MFSISLGSRAHDWLSLLKHRNLHSGSFSLRISVTQRLRIRNALAAVAIFGNYFHPRITMLCRIHVALLNSAISLIMHHMYNVTNTAVVLALSSISMLYLLLREFQKWPFARVLLVRSMPDEMNCFNV